MSALLAARGITVAYGSVPAIQDVTIEVGAGEIVALLGANGAGKTTTVLTLAGELTPTVGTIEWLGRPTTSRLHQRAREGLAFIGDDRSVFMELSVKDNIELGRCDLDRVLEIAPELAPHLRRRVGLLSGGQQQILTVARGIARDSKVLLADELSFGLAPMVVDRLLRHLREAADAGLGVVLVEQQLHKALEYADRVYVLRGGRVSFEGRAKDARRDFKLIEAAYLDVEVPVEASR